MNSCHRCKWLFMELESWEMPDCCWFGCHKHSNYTNLTSFPFQQTKCPDFEKVSVGDEPLMGWREVLGREGA